MSFRVFRWFLALILATLPTIGCGGSNSIEEGMPDDVEQAEKEFEAEFEKMQGMQGEEMANP